MTWWDQHLQRLAVDLAAIARTGLQGREYVEDKLKHFEGRARAYHRLRAMVEAQMERMRDGDIHQAA